MASLKKYLAIVLILASLAFISPAQANLQLSLDAGGGNTALVIDNGSGDLNSTAGLVAYAGTLGNFVLNIAVGESKPALGSASDPQISLYSVNITGWNGGGTLTMRLTDIDFTSTGLTNFSLGVSGFLSSGGTLLYNAYADNSNTAFGIGTSICSLTFTSSSFNDVCGNTIGTDGSYSLTLKTVISLPGSFDIVKFNAGLTDPPTVPEPSALLLVGVGLIGLAAWGKRQIKRRPK